MLQIEPVSKYRKEAYSKFTKQKGRSKEQNKNSQLSQCYSLQQVEMFNNKQQDIAYDQRQFQDANLTKFLHQQLVLIKFTMTFLGLSSILLCFIESLSSFSGQLADTVLLIHSLVSVSLVILVSLKYIKTIELKEKQLIKQKRQNQWVKWINNTIWQSLLLLIHPNYFAKSVVFQVQEPIYGTQIPLTLNKILQIIVLLRLYLLFQAIIVSSIYSSPRASRMCRIYTTKQEQYFGIKSIFNSYPLHSLLVLSVSLVFVLSLMLKLSQQNNPSFQDYANVIWCIVITMGTVGYGDYYPSSYLGRIIAFIAAISGIILTSLLILTLSQKLAMNTKENKSHITLKRLQLRKIMQKFAQQTIISTSSLGFETMPGQVQNLKKKTEEVKLSLRRLKNMTDDDNLSDEISHMFEALDGSLMKIYLQQKIYAEALKQLKEKEGQQIQEINFTFAGQIQNIIKDH